MKQLLFIAISLALATYLKAQNNDSLFEASKGSWKFPIAHIQKADTLQNFGPNITTDMINVSFYAADDQQVTAVYPGEVVQTLNVYLVHVVVVKSGSYYVTYSGLDKPLVMKNDWVQAGTVLGKLKKDKEEYCLDVLLFKDQQQLKPHRWFNWNSLPAYLTNSGKNDTTAK